MLVATFGETNDFPAFYSKVSGCKSSYYVSSATKAAEIIKTSREMDLNSGKEELICRMCASYLLWSG